MMTTGCPLPSLTQSPALNKRNPAPVTCRGVESNRNDSSNQKEYLNIPRVSFEYAW